MRYRELRRVLQTVILAGLPATAAGCADGLDGEPQCSETREERFVFDVTAVDPSLELRIESCRLDADACRELCVMAMQRAERSGWLNECSVLFQGDEALVDITFTFDLNNPGCAVDGRRPAGLARPVPPTTRTRAGAYLAHAAWLEAASIHAFVQLARELEAHGAPSTLVRGALAAARDEVRHTTLMTKLAARYGARPEVPEVAAPATRSLEDIAVENMIEGCVRETWGAVVALWQSNVVRDPLLRAAFAEIAKDEARHAALAWAIDRWIGTRLDATAKANVAAARRVAARELLDSEIAHAQELVAELGLPDATQQRELLARSNASLWMGGAA